MNWTAAGMVLTLVFGIVSLLQTWTIKSLRQSLRAYNQGMYNNLWRIGGNAETALKTNSTDEARELMRGIADMSQTARHTLIAFGREHAKAVPFEEKAWAPAPVKKTWLQKLAGS